MSRRPDIDAGALTAALLQAVTEARATQTTLEEAARGENAGQSSPSIEAIRERLVLLAKLRDMGMEIVRALGPLGSVRLICSLRSAAAPSALQDLA